MSGRVPLSGGGSLAYSAAGVGEPLVLISGLGGLASFWQPLLPFVSTRFRTITYDHRGCGHSSGLDGSTSISAMAADLAALMDRLGIRAATIVGHSTGGAIAQRFALLHPDRVRALVLSATFARPCAYMQRLFAGRKEILDRLGVEAYRRHAVTLLNAPYWLARNDAAVEAELQASEIGPIIDADDIRHRIDAVLAHDALEELRLIQAPTKVVVASDDVVTPAYHSAEIAESIQGASLTVLPRGGHYAIRAEPDQYCNALLPFLGVQASAADLTRTAK